MIITREMLPEGVDPDEPLELALEAMPLWVQDEQGGRYRPVMCIVVGAESAFCYAMEMPERPGEDFATAIRVLSLLQESLGPSSARAIRLSDPELATILRARPELQNVEFEVVDRLEAVRHVLTHALPRVSGPALPSPLDAAGMTVERLASFAHAAVAMHMAQPWKHLFDSDYIQVHSPRPPSGMRIASVLGAAKETYGIGFHSGWRDVERVLEGGPDNVPLPRWSMLFYAADEAPAEEASLWEEHGLRLAPDESLPMLLQYLKDGGVARADAARTAFVEGLCRALSQTTAGELDRGRWEKRVQTADGEVTYRLSLPGMCEQLPRITATDPRERAFELLELARDASPRRSMLLARQALELDPDSVHAYLVMGDRQADPAESEPMYRQAVEAGRRALGDAPFTDPSYPWWLDVETRPYMTALASLGHALASQERNAEAAEIYDQLLRLNRNDNQGIRYLQAPLLIGLGRLDEATRLLDGYGEDINVLWPLCRALIAFKQGRRDEAVAALREAHECNQNALSVMGDPQLQAEGSAGLWSPGDISEALLAADYMQSVWMADAAAYQWLLEQIPTITAAPSTRSSRRRRGRQE